jgi:hypothetical protein
MKRTRVTVLVGLVASMGCATTTAHRVRLDGNPLRAEAEACERRCAGLLVPVRASCDPSPDDLGRACQPYDIVDRAPYATCLDSCPGATAIDGASCPDPAADGFCAETRKANPGAIVGGTVAAATVVTAIAFIGAIFSSQHPVILP